MVLSTGFLDSSMVQNPPAMQEMKETRFDSWVRKIPWKRKWNSTTLLLHGKSHEQRSLASYSPWDCKELDMIEQAYTHTWC